MKARSAHFSSSMPRHWLLAGAVALALPAPALADAVTDWNAITNQQGARPYNSASSRSRRSPCTTH